MAMTLVEIDAAILRASRSTKVSSDGMSREGPGLEELIKLRASTVAEEASNSKMRPVLYQRFVPTSSGDAQ